MLDNINRALNSIDAQIARLKKSKSPQASSIAAAGAALENSLTANYKNDEDSIMYPPKIREDVLGLVFSSSAGPVLPTMYQAATIVKTEYARATAQTSAWLAQARAVH